MLNNKNINNLFDFIKTKSKIFFDNPSKYEFKIKNVPDEDVFKEIEFKIKISKYKYERFASSNNSYFNNLYIFNKILELEQLEDEKKLSEKTLEFYKKIRKNQKG